MLQLDDFKCQPEQVLRLVKELIERRDTATSEVSKETSERALVNLYDAYHLTGDSSEYPNRLTQEEYTELQLDEIYVPKGLPGLYPLSTLLKEQRISEYYLKFIPKECECGYSTIATQNLSTITCANLRCEHRLANALVKIVKAIKIPNIGGKTAYTLIQEYHYKSVLDFFIRPPIQYTNVIASALQESKTYTEWVQFLNFPNFTTLANKIFKGISNYADYTSKVKTAGGLTSFVLSRVGGSGKLAENIAYILNAYNYELEHIEEVFKIKGDSRESIKVAMTGDIKKITSLLNISRMSKEQYREYLNFLNPNVIRIIKTESVNQARFVIADYKTSSAKYLEGELQGKLITSDKFAAVVKNWDIVMMELKKRSGIVHKE